MRCKTEPWSIAKILREYRMINFDPPYQRQGTVWKETRKTDFIDSLVNGFDVPKLYLHVLVDDGPYRYAVVDGKQRLTTILDFLEDRFRLGGSFEVDTEIERNLEGAAPRAGTSYGEWPEDWKQYLKEVNLDIVEVTVPNDDAEEKIQELFRRLNEGVPLNAAEKRRAMGGNLAILVTELSQSVFFKNYLPFTNARYKHEELTARIVRMAQSSLANGPLVTDIKDKNLKDMYAQGSKLPEQDLEKIQNRTQLLLNNLIKVFEPQQPLLKSVGLIPGYIAFIEEVIEDYAHPELHKLIGKFIVQFELRRLAGIEKLKNEVDYEDMRVYKDNAAQGLTGYRSIAARKHVLVKHFLRTNPIVKLKDKNRAFKEHERWVIWLQGGKKCQSCNLELPSLSDMHADHKTAWSVGGETSLENAQSLCEGCNTRKGAR
jgi:hypothetical protein